MPLYEYRCESCQHDFELLVRGQELPACPKCESTRLEKLLSSPSAVTSSSRVSLPVTSACDTSGPVCGPACCRLPQ